MSFCPSCGRPVADNVIFCLSCGYNLQTQPQGSQQPPASASLPVMAGAGGRMPRPVGVTIIAVLDGLAGFLMLLGGAELFWESAVSWGPSAGR